MVIYPVSSLRVANKAIDLLFKDIQSNGTQKGSIDKYIFKIILIFRMYTRKELYGTLGYTPGKEWYYPEVKSPKKK